MSIRITLTDEEQKFVRENYRSMSAAELEKELNIPEGKVRANKTLMGLKKKNRRGEGQ